MSTIGIPSLPDLFRQTAAERPSQPAIVTDDLTLDYRTLDEQSDRVAAALRGKRIEKGTRIALYSPNSVNFVITYLGIVKAGATVVPINILLNIKEIGFILDNSEATGLFHHQGFTQTADQLRESCPTLLWTINMESAPEAGSRHGHQDPESRPTAIEFSVQEDLAAIIYTSGTTGFPKGAMLTHHNLVTNTFSARDAIGFLPGEDRMLVVLPLFHSFAATIGMLSTLLHGGSFIPLPRFEPEAVAGAIATHKATIFLGVPSMYNLLLRLPDSLTAKLSSLRLCASGGAALPVEIMRRFEARFDCPIYEGDGPTECSPLTCLNPIDGERKPGSVGLPVPQVEMRILDEQGTELPDGEVGEICVRGPNVMKGYWKLPEETRASFFDDWFRTGDLGYRDEDGYFFMVDRKKDMIIVNGMNVYPRMIEEVLYCIPEIAEAAVVGEPSPLHGEIPVAYVALKKPDDASSSQIRAYCREHLGRHEVPRKIFFMPELPKNATGKILKRELRKHGELERGVDSREPEISK